MFSTWENLSNRLQVNMLLNKIYLHYGSTIYRKFHKFFYNSKKPMLGICDPCTLRYLILVFFFISRRNRYVLVANFGEEHVNLEPVGQIYSGGELVLDTSNTLNFIDQEENLSNQVVKFSSIDLQPNEAIVIKLPKWSSVSRHIGLRFLDKD